MSLNKIVSLENFDEIKDNFTLRSPNRGKIYRGPNWNAYNRESLGSIPQNTEKILFKEKNSDNKKGFSCQSERFDSTNKNESIKFSYPGPAEYKVRSTTSSFDISTNPSLSEKGYGVGFVSKSERFDERKEYYDKYYPGPGQYKNAKVNQKESMRYRSLYNLKENKSLLNNKHVPGPGEYDTMPKKDDDPLKENFYFQSRIRRFKNDALENEKNKPGPGNYFYHPDNLFLHNPEKESFFFKISLEKKIDPVEKNLNIQKVPKFYIPGPGQYNLRKELLDETKIVATRKPLISESDHNIEKEREIERLSKLKNQKKEYIVDPYKIPYENMKRGMKSIFLSNSPKSSYLRVNHIPGPSYYNPTSLPPKVNFNFNEDKNWI